MEATQHHLVEIKSLSIEFEMSYGRNAVLHDVSFAIPRGKIVALVGESGSGKSLTAQAILGILPRNAHIVNGQILYHSPQTQQVIDIAALGRDSKAMQQLRGNQISIIFQEPMVSLSPVHTLLNQIGEALSLHHQVAKSDIKQRVLLMLEKVGFPDPQRALTQYPFELSGGLRQRAMIAMALICQPTLLIADEPTTALDVTVQAQILNLIKSLQAEFTMSVLLITHDLGVVANMADEVAVMFRGRIVERGPIQSLFSQPRHPYLKALFTALPELGQRHKRLQPLREIKHDTDGMRNRRQAWSEAQRQQAPHLCINTVSKTYYSRHGAWFGTTQAHQAVNALSLDIAVGESFGLVGESGCGKTTLSKLLMGAMQPDSGQITYNDRGNIIELTTLDQHSLRAFRPKMQMVFQDPFSSLSPRMTVLDTLREPLIIHQRGDAAFQLERARELMAMVGLDERYLNRYPHSFSGGQRQRISIARALALEPDLLILDEPVSALDVSVQAQVLNLLRDLQAELGLTYLFISHNLAVVDYIADRVGVMCRGQLVEIATSRQLFNQARHPYTRALLAAIPYADLKHPLNMAELDREHLLSDAWPAPYTLKDGETGQWVEINPGHFVRERSAHEERSNA